MADYEWGSIDCPQDRKAAISKSVLTSLVIEKGHSINPEIARIAFKGTLKDMGYTFCETPATLDVHLQRHGKALRGSLHNELFGSNDEKSAEYSIPSLAVSFAFLINNTALGSEYEQKEYINVQVERFIGFLKYRIRTEIDLVHEFILLNGEKHLQHIAEPYRHCLRSASDLVPDGLYRISMEYGERAHGTSDPLALWDAKQMYDLDMGETPKVETVDRYFRGLYLAQVVRSKGLQVKDLYTKHKDIVRFCTRKKITKTDRHSIEEIVCIHFGLDAVRDGELLPALGAAKTSNVPQKEISS